MAADARDTILAMHGAGESGAAVAPSRPWLAMALTFLLLGAGYALPVRLAPNPPSGLWPGSIAPEVLNLYALTAFAGWAHFAYAWRGQIQGTLRMRKPWQRGYWAIVVACIAALLALRTVLGVGLFSVLVWIWFIAHFVKAEQVFAGSAARAGRFVSWQPVLAFAWLSVVLFYDGIQERPWALFAGCSALAALILFIDGWRCLIRGTSLLPVLALFFDGEAYVWGSYGRYMHPAFRIGVYVFHIAGASFFHYLGSYSFGNARAPRDRWLSLAGILAVNIAVIGLCCGVQWIPALSLVSPLLGLGWFTLWVAAHLAASDLLPCWKKLSTRDQLPMAVSQ